MTRTIVRRRHVIALSICVAALLALPSAGAGQQIFTPTVQSSDRFFGSVPAGDPTAETLQLSLKDALDRALEYNLGLRERDQDVRAARATRLANLNALLPDVSGAVSLSRQKINLASLGVNLSIPGVNIPSVVGPFNVADARVYVTQEIFNLSSIKHWKAAAVGEQASEHASKSGRELVILVAGQAYLTVIADHAAVDTTRAQLTTAEALYTRAVDQNRAGVIARIDALRARVEQQTQQQRLIAAENQLAVDKLMLARIIGLPKGQAFEISDSIPYAPLDGITLEQALARAVTTRPDYLGAKARVEEAELRRAAAVAGNYPWLAANADYGGIGSPGFAAARGTFNVGVTLTVPIFQGTRVRADILEADSALQQRKAELADLDGAIDQQVRTAFLNLQSSSDLVTVAQSNVDLASQTLEQARDRAAAGVADSLDVVQAQESVASASQAYIGSLYGYNLAKISLAQAIGIAEESALHYLGAK